VPDPRAVGIHGRTLRAAALKGLESEIAARTTALLAADDGAITLSEHGKLWWDGAIVAKLAPGSSSLDAECRGVGGRTCEDRRVAGAARSLGDGSHRHASWSIVGLARCGRSKNRNGRARFRAKARGIAHQLAENFAALDRAGLALPEKLGPLLRALKPFGVWFGRRTIYLPKLLRPMRRHY